MEGIVISCARAELARVLAAFLLSAASAAAMAVDADVHPEMWPQAHSPGLVDDWHGDFQIPISLFVETQLPHP